MPLTLLIGSNKTIIGSNLTIKIKINCQLLFESV